MSKLETNTIDNVSGSTTLTIGDSNASTISIPKNITLGASGTTITVPAGATITNNGTQSGFGGTMTPNFQAYRNSAQTISSGVETKAQFNLESFDASSIYDNTTNYRFTVPSGQAGKYFVYSMLRLLNTNNNSVYGSIIVKKNSSPISNLSFDFTGSSIMRQSNHTYTEVLDLSVGDYIEIYGQADGSGTISILQNSTFGAYKIIE